MHCILLESHRHHGTATVYSDGVLIVGVKDRLLNVSQRYKTPVRDAQSSADCTLPSNHRLVTINLIAPKQHGCRWRNTNQLSIDTDNLIDGRDLQKESADAVALTLPTVPLKESSWNEFGAVLCRVSKSWNADKQTSLGRDNWAHKLSQDRPLMLQLLSITAWVGMLQQQQELNSTLRGLACCQWVLLGSNPETRSSPAVPHCPRLSSWIRMAI